MFNVRQLARETRRVLAHARCSGAIVRDIDGTAMVVVPRAALGELELLRATMANWLLVSQAVHCGSGRPSLVQLGDWIGLADRDDAALREFLDACCVELYRAVRTLDMGRLTSFLEEAELIEGHEQRIARRVEQEWAAEEAAARRRAQLQEASPARRAEEDAVARDELVGLMAARAVMDGTVHDWELDQEEHAAVVRLWRRNRWDGRPYYDQAVVRHSRFESMDGIWLPGMAFRRWRAQSGTRALFQGGRCIEPEDDP